MHCDLITRLAVRTEEDEAHAARWVFLQTAHVSTPRTRHEAGCQQPYAVYAPILANAAVLSGLQGRLSSCH